MIRIQLFDLPSYGKARANYINNCAALAMLRHSYAELLDKVCIGHKKTQSSFKLFSRKRKIEGCGSVLRHIR